MPGVPSGRACEACRKLKKKCDEVKPKCGRCARLNIECVGSGLRRFKFQFHNKSTPDTDSDRGASDSPRSSDIALSRTPDLAKGSLRSALIKTMLPTTDVRFNLAYSYGEFIETVPQRIGVNPALDAAVEVLVAAHADVCSGSSVIPMRTVSLHSQALQNLRTCLNDPETAQSIETLGAVMVLLMLQVFVGADENYWSQHYVGAAQILKARNYRYDPNDEFEAVLLATLRGPVLMEAILSGRLKFTPKEWKKFMGYRNPKASSGDQTMESVSLIPDLLQRRRKAQDPADLQQLRFDTQLHYGLLKANTASIRSRLDTFDEASAIAASAAIGVPLKYALQRAYAFSIFFAITLNLVLRSFDTWDEDVVTDGEYFADEIVAIAREALQHRPIGALYISISLMAVYTMTADPLKQAQIAQAYHAAVEGFPWADDLDAGMWDCSLEAGLKLPGLEIPDILQRNRLSTNIASVNRYRSRATACDQQ